MIIEKNLTFIEIQSNTINIHQTNYYYESSFD